MKRAWQGLILAVATAVACATPAAAADRWWGGGGIGLALGGNVDFVSVEPVIGYWVTEQFTVGSRAILRSRRDDRFAESVTSTDYGAALFARYLVTKSFFVQGEYEYLSYELRSPSGSDERDEFGSWLAGGGYSQKLSRNARFFVSALYNFSYDEDEPSPYDQPWVLRAGVGFRF